MTKKLGQYLAENEAVHEFRVKMACEPTDKQLDALELHLRKYEGFDVGTPQKTIMQRNPRDFRSIDAAEVYMVDFKTRQPASPQHLLAEISEKTGIHERFLVVRNKMESLHIEDEAQGLPEEDYHTRLTDAEYSEVEQSNPDDYYGEQFKDSFIKEIAKERKGLSKEK